MEDNKKCIRDILVRELDDLKARERLMKVAYQEDAEECRQKIERIREKCKSIDMVIENENRNFNKKLIISGVIAILICGIIMLTLSTVFVNIGINLSLSMLLGFISTLLLDVPVWTLCLHRLYKKSCSIESLYQKEQFKLMADEVEYRKMIEQAENEYFKSLNLVAEKEKEIANFDHVMMISDLSDDKEDTLNKSGNFTRKLERK